MWSARAASWTTFVRSKRPLAQHPLEQLLRAGLVERHVTRRELSEHGVLALDPDHVEAAVGEREGERQADPPQADHRDAGRGH